MIGAALADWLRGGDRLDDALGLPRTWRQDAARGARDELVRRIVWEHYGNRSAREASERFARRLNEFRNSADWRSGRTKAACPFAPGIRADMWALLRLVDRPLGLFHLAADG